MYLTPGGLDGQLVEDWPLDSGGLPWPLHCAGRSVELWRVLRAAAQFCWNVFGMGGSLLNRGSLC